MSVKLGYSAEEWETLRGLPIDAAMAVIMSGRSGPLQLVRESKALSDGIRAAAGSPVSLIAEVAAELANARNLLRGGGGDEDLVPRERARRARADAIEEARLVDSILAAKASRSDAEAYKRWVLDLARTVAVAAPEKGGFLGFGGDRVADEERAALDEFEAALGVSD